MRRQWRLRASICFCCLFLSSFRSFSISMFMLSISLCRFSSSVVIFLIGSSSGFFSGGYSMYPGFFETVTIRWTHRTSSSPSSTLFSMIFFNSIASAEPFLIAASRCFVISAIWWFKGVKLNLLDLGSALSFVIELKSFLSLCNSSFPLSNLSPYSFGEQQTFGFLREVFDAFVLRREGRLAAMVRSVAFSCTGPGGGGGGGNFSFFRST
mmetsp:Transcript_8582/g.16618  ORF Transcript_8582/g.16618 Transcript_8582/m.16618 type:complete len:210 (-) Transcript_8582:2-631(-)